MAQTNRSGKDLGKDQGKDGENAHKGGGGLSLLLQGMSKIEDSGGSWDHLRTVSIVMQVAFGYASSIL